MKIATVKLKLVTNIVLTPVSCGTFSEDLVDGDDNRSHGNADAQFN